jgi:DNA excision repair protein ERCC-3
MFFSTKRQQYLIDQGYTFKVVQDLADIADRESTLLTTVEQEIQLLNKVLCFNYASYDAVEDRELSRKAQGEMEDEDDAGAGGGGGGGEVRRRAGKLSAVSGAGGSVYTEFDA